MTMQEMVKRDLQKYLDFGYSLAGAVRQVKALRAGWGAIIDAVAAELAKG